jgi:very-short-patch-repair endonuclease
MDLPPSDSPPLKKGVRGDLKITDMLNYNPRLKNNARQLRKKMTDSERRLWARLRGKQLLGVQFYRQKPIGDHIVDFFAPKAKLVIEVDGSQHKESRHAAKDKCRDDFLSDNGLKVLRFNSNEVLNNTDEVLDVVYQTMVERLR